MRCTLFAYVYHVSSYLCLSLCMCQTGCDELWEKKHKWVKNQKIACVSMCLVACLRVSACVSGPELSTVLIHDTADLVVSQSTSRWGSRSLPPPPPQRLPAHPSPPPRPRSQILWQQTSNCAFSSWVILRWPYGNFPVEFWGELSCWHLISLWFCLSCWYLVCLYTLFPFRWNIAPTQLDIFILYIKCSNVLHEN